MLILHISDIHFRAGNPDLDPDLPYRTILLNHVRDFVEKSGETVDALLIGGDIAYSGLKAEYDIALKWIYELAEICGCKRERIFVIPGNHDVDQGIIKARLIVQNAQQAIALATDQEKALRTQFLHKETGDALLAPLAAYNELAALFQCQVYTPDRLYWHQNIPLDDTGVDLRIYGLTSTLLSGAGSAAGVQDSKQSLYLSPLQTVLNPVDNVVNLVMCHHPPEWLKDGEDVAEKVKERSAIQLFGHRHRQRVDPSPRYITLNAGAVNPERNEPGWEPGYNIIKLELGKTGSAYHLDVEAHLMCWQSNPDCFRPKRQFDGSDVLKHRVGLANNIRPKAAASAKPQTAAAVVTQAVDAEAAMGDERSRNIVLRFWNLASSQRREIVEKLDLIDSADMKLAEPERYGRALTRAGERKLMNELAEEIEQMENQ
jgi:predicted phosphodiesterase